MDPIELEPKYTSHDVAGKCLRCMAQEQLSNCIVEMLGTGEENSILQQKYNALVAFLQSPEAQDLINETERLLSDGKKVNVRLHFENDNLSYELKIEQ